MKQNLAFAFVYNALGVPLAAGVLFPFTGWLLSPMIAALAPAAREVAAGLRHRAAGRGGARVPYPAKGLRPTPAGTER